MSEESTKSKVGVAVGLFFLLVIVGIVAVAVFDINIKGKTAVGEFEIGKPSISKENKTEFSAEIVSPKDGSEVSNRIKLKGTMTSSVPSGHHLWIALRNNNLLWPKDPEVYVSGKGQWQTTISESGSGEFLLVLYLVDESTHETIKEWYLHGSRNGDFPGLESISGTVLDSVTIVRN